MKRCPKGQKRYGNLCVPKYKKARWYCCWNKNEDTVDIIKTNAMPTRRDRKYKKYNLCEGGYETKRLAINRANWLDMPVNKIRNYVE